MVLCVEAQPNSIENSGLDKTDSGNGIKNSAPRIAMPGAGLFSGGFPKLRSTGKNLKEESQKFSKPKDQQVNESHHPQEQGHHHSHQDPMKKRYCRGGR